MGNPNRKSRVEVRSSRQAAAIASRNESIRPIRAVPIDTPSVMTGTVRRFIDDKGYGFITPDGGGRDVFVHCSEILTQGRKTLTEGVRVRYTVTESPKGPRAEGVEPI